MERKLLIVVLPFIFLIFQNFAALPVTIVLDAKEMTIGSASTLSIDQKTLLNEVFVSYKKNRVAEAKAQGAGNIPRILKTSNIDKTYTSFSIDHDLNYITEYQNKKNDFSIQHPDAPEFVSNDRSEIRIIGSETHFTEGQTPQISYSSFKFFLPGRSDLILSNTIDKNWALIWQCAQHGGTSSPPLSLHIENDVLSMVAYQDFTEKAPDRQVIQKLERDRWYDVTLRYKLGENGSYAVWVNGVSIPLNAYYNSKKSTPVKYLPIGYKNAIHQGKRSCRVSYGLYKNSSPGYFEVLFKGINFSDTYQRFK